MTRCLKHIALTLSLFILVLPAARSSNGKSLEVGKNSPYTTIKSAVEAAEEGDHIIVHAGIYQENEILIRKRIRISGQGKPVIDAGFSKGIFTIEGVDSVQIEGFVLRNIEMSYMKDYAAIRLFRSHYALIRDNSIEDAFFGIYLEKADHAHLINNRVTGKAQKESSSGNAIHLWHSRDAHIIGNQLKGHRDGIYLEFVDNSVVENNISRNNIRYGLHFMFSNDNKYKGNSFIKNGAGVAVMYSRNIDMQENLFSDNWGPAAYGLLLKEIKDSQILHNTFSGNTIGIYAEGSNRLKMVENEFSQNGWAFKMMGSCESLEIRQNNFIGNTFELSTSANRQNDNVFVQNYWSSYTGYDLDKDGLGDVPHRPVKLFSYLLEKSPESIVLLRSIFAELLELAEKVTPVLTPEFIMDESPSMKLNKW